jgi:transposase InsO family protein
MSTAMRQRAERANQIWSWDFVHDQTQEGRPFRILTLIDEHTKQCLATHVGWSVRAVDVITVIEASIQRYGAPEHIRSDNGSEFIPRAIQDWLSDNETPWSQYQRLSEEVHDIEPGLAGQ